jgi:hypothetical protein
MVAIYNDDEVQGGDAVQGRDAVHPDRERLEAFVRQEAASTEVAGIEKHLAGCEFCAEFCRNHRLYLDSGPRALPEDLPPESLRLARKLFGEALYGQVILLRPRPESAALPGRLLAADGERESPPEVECLTTLYSESPAVLLRLMRDTAVGGSYLQLISDDPELVANVLVRVPALGREFVTDSRGRARLTEEPSRDWSDLQWQIKMPEAVFDLEPLLHDPDRVEYSREIMLRTERDDAIQIRFEGKAEGKQIRLRVLKLDGRPDFTRVTVSLGGGAISELLEAEPGQAVSFDIATDERTLNIRLFQ